MFGTTVPLFDSENLKTICAQLLKEGEAVSHRSIPPRLGHPADSFCPSAWCRKSRVLGLPSFAPLDYAVRFHGFRSGASLGATRRHSRRFASGYSLCCALRPPLAGYSETSPASGTRRPHLACGGVCTALLLLHTGDTPTCSDTKRGGGLPPPQGVKMSNSQSVRHSLKRRAFQRFGRIGHREIEEANTHRVAVLALHDCTTAPSTRNLGRRRVALRDSP